MYLKGFNVCIPENLQELKIKISQYFKEIQSAKTNVDLFNIQKIKTSIPMPPQYLVYFLLIYFLDFTYAGRWEKIAWSIPISYKKHNYYLIYSKFGLKIWSNNPDEQTSDADEIIQLIHRAIKDANPFFDYIANDAIDSSELNITNQAISLFEKYTFFKKKYSQMLKRAESKKDVAIRKKFQHYESVSYPYYDLKKKANWLKEAMIDAFFAWTEHVFVLLPILLGNVHNGKEIFSLIADKTWSEKYKLILPLNNLKNKELYDNLTYIREHFRNHIAHGSFGRDLSSFYFHSYAGAIQFPRLKHKKQKDKKFEFMWNTTTSNNTQIPKIFENFIKYLWSGKRAIAKLYIQGNVLPIYIPFVKERKYEKAMLSKNNMIDFIDYLHYMEDMGANMDW